MSKFNVALSDAKSINSKNFFPFSDKVNKIYFYCPWLTPKALIKEVHY